MIRQELYLTLQIQTILNYCMPWTVEGYETSKARKQNWRPYKLYRTIYRHLIVIFQFVYTIILTFPFFKPSNSVPLIICAIYFALALNALLISLFMTPDLENNYLIMQAVNLDKQFTGIKLLELRIYYHPSLWKKHNQIYRVF